VDITETMDTQYSELKHYGVKGQKWGVRNPAKHPPHPGFNNKGKPIPRMTDAQLKSGIDRMTLEKKYSNLVKDKHTNAGMKFAKKHGGQMVGALASMAVTTIGQHYIRKALVRSSRTIA